MLKVGTTFSGIGAAEQALKNLKIDHEILWACDIDKHCKQTYFANHTCKKWYDDITKININELEYVDLYVFGFPCVDISNMGQQNLLKGRSLLVNYSLNIIEKLIPKYILFENVKTLLANKFKEFFNCIIEKLSKNYNITYKILNSKDYNSPQNRERIFCIGIRKNINKNYVFPLSQKLEKNLFDLLEQNVSDFYLNKEKWYLYYNSHWKKEKGFVKINPEIARCLTTRDFYNYRGSFVSQYNITNIKNSTKQYKELFYIEDKIRRLTEKECARLQCFPENFIIPVNDKQAYKQFGNTITVTVLEAIFKNLL